MMFKPKKNLLISGRPRDIYTKLLGTRFCLLLLKTFGNFPISLE
jgi:hypothetical protein